MVWPLTLNAWSFKGEPFAEPDYRDILSAFNEEDVEYLIDGLSNSMPVVESFWDLP